MSRLYIALFVFAIVGSLAAALWWQIDRNAALRAKLDAANSTIETSEDFNDAASNPDGKSWLERLLPSSAD